MFKKNKEPIAKIGTQDEALFTDLKQRTETAIIGLEKEMKVQRAVLDMCIRIIALEKGK